MPAETPRPGRIEPDGIYTRKWSGLRLTLMAIMDLIEQFQKGRSSQFIKGMRF